MNAEFVPILRTRRLLLRGWHESDFEAIDWAWAALDARRLISVIHPENAPSVRLAERLGFRPLRDELVNGQHVVIFGIERRRDV